MAEALPTTNTKQLVVKGTAKTVKSGVSSVLDLNTTDSHKLVVVDPNGNKNEYQTQDVGDGSDGEWRYTLATVSIAGIWKFDTYAVIGTTEIETSRTKYLEVVEGKHA